MYRVSFTGYRESKLPFFGNDDPLLADLKNRLSEVIRELIRDGAEEFYSGMALGVDTYAAEAVLLAKEQFSGIRLIAVIPCADQDKLWNAAQRQRYREILAQCDRTITISASYDKGCMQKRNRALVELCDILVAVYDGKPGGTQYTIDYARKIGRKIIELPPT